MIASVASERKFKKGYEFNSNSLPFIYLRCPARECHSPHKCKGNLDTSFSVSHLEDCIHICKERPSCKWYTLDKAIDRCVLYENCTLHTEVCDTCATGPEDCSRGYHGVEKKQIRQRTVRTYYDVLKLEEGRNMMLNSYTRPNREACIDICKEVPAQSAYYELHESTEYFVAFGAGHGGCLLFAYESSYTCTKGWDCHNCESGSKSNACEVIMRYCSYPCLHFSVDYYLQLARYSWLCDVDWSQTYVVSEDGDILQRRDFDLSKLWGPGAPGDGKDDRICGYIPENCSYGIRGMDADMALACAASYDWFKTEENSWLCDVNWSLTYRENGFFGVVKSDDFDLNKIWGFGARGQGKDDKICGYIVDHCPDVYDGYSADYICSMTYEWFNGPR